MSENHREPEVPETEASVVERLDGLARITLEELAITHFVKNGTLQNACSTRPRVVVGLEKSAHTHTVRLMNNLVKGSKNDDKSAVAMLKINDWHENVRQLVVSHGKSPDRSVRPDKNRDHELKRGPTGRRSSNARQLGCVFQDMKPPKSILRKSPDMKPVQRVKFTKAVARHTKFRDQNPSLGIFAQENLVSVAPTLQNLRIGLRRRQSGKSKVPLKQRGCWSKIYSKLKEKHKTAFFPPSENWCLPEPSTLNPEENLLSTPERRCT